ncbi:MAG: DUF6702 family protein [Bacteroidota bacterium]
MAASVYKWLFIPLLAVLLTSARPVPPHPFHVSVVEIEHNITDKSLEISCKIFTDDFEKVLAETYKTKVDLINPPNKVTMDSLVKKYILSHLSVKVNGKPCLLKYVGFENESEAAYGYFEIENISSVTKIELTNTILFDRFDDQMNIMHVKVNGNRKSTKLNYPDKEAAFSF